MRILVVTGASGGHIYPALAFLERLKEEKSISNALLVLPSRQKTVVCLPIGKATRSIKTDFKSCGYKLEYISSARISFFLNRSNIIALCKFIKGSWESFRILIKFKPDCVVGFGSIDSIPLVILAWFFRIKTLIHEQNVLPGRANRFLAKFADKIAVSFPDSVYHLGCARKKIVLTGNPLRRSLKKLDKARALNFFGLDKNKFTILVMGGSQGSRHINDAFLKVAPLIKNRLDLQVIHLIGKGESEPVYEAYKKINIKAKVFGFFEAMEFAYSAADLAVTRGGATTVSELIYFKLPAIISPYPYAYEHQYQNAKVLSDKGCVVIIKDGNLDSSLFIEALELLIKNKDRLNSMISGFASLVMPNAAADRLAEEVFK